jgi:hypothetical protein
VFGTGTGRLALQPLAHGLVVTYVFVAQRPHPSAMQRPAFNQPIDFEPQQGLDNRHGAHPKPFYSTCGEPAAYPAALPR